MKKGTIKKFFWRSVLLGFLSLVILIAYLFYYMNYKLPDVETLKDVHMQVPLQIFTADHKLIAEFGEKRRIPVDYKDIPKPLIDAVLATEDQRYFEHSGIDIPGLARATLILFLTGKKEQGGSTITMQVARNFFLTKKKTYSRKIKEILLALKIDHEFSKQKILELYFNKIFLGHRAYGVAAAAQVYYGKPLDALTLPQYAMIAGLPKAPSSLNPLSHPEAAIKRRNHVLKRMFELHYINQVEYETAINTPVTAKYHSLKVSVKAPYIAEMVRQWLENHYGKAIYTTGLDVYTTINSKDQVAANNAVRKALLSYDQRHGYRGPLQNLGDVLPKNLEDWQTTLKDIPSIAGLSPAVVIGIEDKSATIMLSDGTQSNIPWSGLAWGQKFLSNGKLGKKPELASDVVALGDIIRVMPWRNKSWRLAQLPDAEAAIVSIDPKNGKVLALVGGFNFNSSNFNRIVDASRQTGSSFKPFVYSAALAKGFSLASIINDAPIVLQDTGENRYWRPQNDTRKFYGPTSLINGIIHSRNLVSIRLLQLAGLPYVINYLTRFGFPKDKLPSSLSLALGSGDLTPMELARGYATFANGGYLIQPYFVDHVIDSNRKVLFQANPLTVPKESTEQADQASPSIYTAPRSISSQVAYLINTALIGVVQHGTGRAAKVIGRKDLAGKTGTTNDQVDAWFCGYNADVVTVSWVGFDQPRTLHEYGSQAALPMWIDFMKHALQGKPEHQLSEPRGLVTVKIDPKTGKRVSADNPQGIFQVFRSENVPAFEQSVAFNRSKSSAQSYETITDSGSLF